MGLMTQIHDGNTTPDQQGNDYAVTRFFLAQLFRVLKIYCGLNGITFKILKRAHETQI